MLCLEANDTFDKFMDHAILTENPIDLSDLFARFVTIR
jgi:hypothetical protein